MDKFPEISIITPCYNEAESVENCALKLSNYMAVNLPGVTYEHIFSDNCSTDATLDKLTKIASLDKRVKVTSLSRNIGASRNIYQALKKASGACIVPMLPADLQDPPEIIGDFYKHWLAGSLVVFGLRTNRQEPILIRTTRKIYYRFIKFLAFTSIPVNAGEFMLIDKKIKDKIVEIEDPYPYVRGLVAQSVDEKDRAFVSYTWQKRKSDKSKSSIPVLIDVAINGLITTSRLPARIAMLCGVSISVISITLGLYTLLSSLIFGSTLISGLTTLVIAVFTIGGLQLLFLGIIGEYILSLHAKIRPEPTFFETKNLNF
jgi:glycosyltransferase involved in cell wall biosynthesis